MCLHSLQAYRNSSLKKTVIISSNLSYINKKSNHEVSAVTLKTELHIFKCVDVQQVLYHGSGHVSHKWS